MIMETAELTGDALDWAVVNSTVDDSCKGNEAFIKGHLSRGSPSRDWKEGGVLIEEWGVTVMFDPKCSPHFIAMTPYGGVGEGHSHLVASMRAIVNSQAGQFVEIPDRFLEVV